MGCREMSGPLCGAFSGQMKEVAKGIEYNSTFDGLATEILGRGSCLRFRAHGNSMAPFIRNGDMVLVEPKRASELCIGDIVFYRGAKGRHIAHRLIDKSGNDGSLTLTTKGDSQVLSDAPVFTKQVLGKVILIEDQGKELRIDGRTGWVFNHLLLYASANGGYGQGMLRRGLTKLWWLVGGKRK